MNSKITNTIKKLKKTKELSGASNKLLAVLAVTALAENAMANEGAMKSEKIIFNVEKILEANGIDVKNAKNIEIAMKNSADGQLVAIGEGLVEFIPGKEGMKEVSIVINGDGNKDLEIDLNLVDIAANYDFNSEASTFSLFGFLENLVGYKDESKEE
jgi:hypothetical protein